jgi:Hsp20/alpha crystallin family
MLTTWSAIPVLERVFDEALRSTRRGSERATFPVAADIVESDKATRGRPSGPFAASYELPEGIDGENLTAGLADGVLTVRVPKQPNVQPRKIAIGGLAGREQLAE